MALSGSNNCCNILPVPGNYNYKKMASYKVFIWVMFTLMILTFGVCYPLAFSLTTGPITLPSGVLAVIFPIITTPSCKIWRNLRMSYPRYAKIVFNYTVANWALGSIAFVLSIVASSIFFLYNGYQNCFVETVYYLKSTYDRGFKDYIYTLENSNDAKAEQCVYFKTGFYFCLASALFCFAQVVLVPCYLTLETKLILNTNVKYHNEGMNDYDPNNAQGCNDGDDDAKGYFPNSKMLR